MADYYHTSREHVKNLKAMQDNAARRAERRTELASIQAEHPMNALRIDARPVKVTRNTEQYRAIESMEGMLPWNGDVSNIIDRFDGRALLDFYKEPAKRKQVKSDEELELEELVALDAFRDLMKLLQRGLDDATGIRTAELENVELRAEAKTQAAAAVGVPFSTTKPASTSEPGMYGAVGFSYDTGAANDQQSDSEEGSSDESDLEDMPQLEDAEVDDMAANMGIRNYSSLLRRVEKQEAEFAQGNVKKAKRMFSRKKAAQRAKRMAGMGLEAFPKTTVNVNTESALTAATRERVQNATHRRSSPSYDRYGSRSRSRSRSPGRAPKMEYITSFSDTPDKRSSRSKRSQHSGAAGRDERPEAFVDALPDRADPSVDGGPVSLPSSAVVMHGRRAGGRDYYERQRARDQDRDREGSKRRRSPPPPLPPGPKPKDPAVKETPMERLKRLRAAQLNKAFQKDALTNAEKKAQEERDRAARLQIEKAAFSRRRSPSPPRPYDRRYDRKEDPRYSVSPPPRRR